MTPPTPTHTHVWDGGDLPVWLQLDHYHFDNNQLVLHSPDGDTQPEPGWTLIRWDNDTVTTASPAVAERVYGADGIAGRLAAAEQRVQRITELRDRWVTAGPPPLGTSINRWWDKRLVELNAALSDTKEN